MSDLSSTTITDIIATLQSLSAIPPHVSFEELAIKNILLILTPLYEIFSSIVSPNAIFTDPSLRALIRASPLPFSELRSDVINYLIGYTVLASVRNAASNNSFNVCTYDVSAASVYDDHLLHLKVTLSQMAK
jgi:hypothetical protein